MTAIIGDTHGNIEELFDVGDGLDGWIQVGDLGWGFGHRVIPEFPDGGKAIRGNHDDPEVARAHPSYLGDYGVTDEGIFYMSGAKTPDFDIARRFRKAAENNSHPMWWEDEQLSYADLKVACALYKETKPEIVVTHDAPFYLYRALIGASRSIDPDGPSEAESNMTATALNFMLDLYQPKFWYFGHWHMNWAMKFKGCWFRCVAPNDIVIAGTLD